MVSDDPLSSTILKPNILKELALIKLDIGK